MVEIPEGMVAWHGGDRAPDDWDGGEGWQRAGGLFHPNELINPWLDEGLPGDIIAYTPKPAPTDTADRREAVRSAISKGLDACPHGLHSEKITAIEDAIASLIAMPVEAWRTIDSAPKDGTPLLLFARCKTATAYGTVIGWHLPDLGWIECAFGPNKPIGIDPTHWMPIPARPGEPA